MKSKVLTIGLLVILLIAGGSGLSVSASQSSGPYGPGAPQLVQELPAWQQANANGFGDPGAGEVSALGVFNGYLYAGTFNPIDPEPLYDGAQIFRSQNGIDWVPDSLPGFGVAHDTAPTAILDMVTFGSYIYASTGRSANEAKIYRTVVANGWAPVVDNGFSDPDNHDIPALAVYDNKIYAGVTNAETGVQIRYSFSGNSGDWHLINPTDPIPAPSSLTGFAVFDGALYGAIQSEWPVQIWNSYGLDWAQVNSNGLGDANNTAAGGMTVYGGFLYVGVGNATDGARLYRTNDAVNWERVTIPGLGGGNNQKVEAVFVYRDTLYVSVKNAVTGIQLWSWTNSTLWERANTDGFGDSHNSSSNGSNATENFYGLLYVGTSNVTDGGELWRIEPKHMYLALIQR